MKLDKVLVIIVTYNGMKWLGQCLDSVVGSSVKADCYIIDNGSTDGSQEFIRSGYPQFIFEQSEVNLGFGAANNIGLQYAVDRDYDYVYLLNQDAWIESNTLEVLIDTNHKNPEYGILSPLQTNANKDKLDKNFAAYFSKNLDIISDSLFSCTKSLYEVEFVMAAHWLISRECLVKVGKFSPVFFHYGEDNNYQHRVMYHGFKSGVVTNTLGVHDREYRETPKTKSVYMVHIQFLIIASNINDSYSSSLIRAYLRAMYAATTTAYKYKDIRIVLKYIFHIYPIFKINRDRKRNKLGAAPRYEK